jgi:hypothetical protein
MTAARPWQDHEDRRTYDRGRTMTIAAGHDLAGPRRSPPPLGAHQPGRVPLPLEVALRSRSSIEEDRVRPSLNILSAELLGQIVEEAKRVLAEVGMEIRGPEMRRRLLAAGLPTNAGERVFFPRDVAVVQPEA